jgi:MoaA/NifB/PqqE/SkfB family radical SAM enzyme
MLTWLGRARDAVLGGARGSTGGEKPVLADEKLRSVTSYADFCGGGEFPAYPLEMFLEVSNVCDLKCAMCVQFSALNAHRFQILKGDERGFFDVETISGHLEDSLRHALVVHCFGYGEPTIHPKFRSLLDFISKFEVMIDFFTNGMHLDEDLCAFLVDRKIQQVTISFSGSTKDIYENIYIGGDFQRVLDGMSRLAKAKKAAKSAYPIIEVNSLGFRDHVDSFESFVRLMAAHGANVVHLKKLQHHKIIPQLYEHVSVARPGVEDEMVRRAVKIGRKRGVRVNVDLYLARGAAGEDDYARQMEFLKTSAERDLGEGDAPFGANPIDKFKEIAGKLPVIRDRRDKRPPRPALGVDVDKEEARAFLGVATPSRAEGEPKFHCMEPFKTLYVSRNGAAKPCCFASPALYLGDVAASDGLDVWRGTGFEVVREAIADGDYPMKSCEVCLRNRSGPRKHFAHHVIRKYLAWHTGRFADPIGRTLSSRMSGALRAIGKAEPSAVMASRRSAAGRG